MGELPDYEDMQQVATKHSKKHGFSDNDLGGMHIRVVSPHEHPCKHTTDILPNLICGPWALLKLDIVRMKFRDNYTPYKLEGEERTDHQLRVRNDLHELAKLETKPHACGNPERLLSSIFLGSKTPVVHDAIRKCFQEDLNEMSRTSLPWHKHYQDCMYLAVEFFRNMSFIASRTVDTGIRYLIEEMRVLSGEVLEAETSEEFWFKLIECAMKYRTYVIKWNEHEEREKLYWFWSELVNLQQGLFADYFPDKLPTKSFSGACSLKEVANLHSDARNFSSLCQMETRGFKMLDFNCEMWNVLVRTESHPVEQGRLIVLCHPAKIIEDNTSRLPIPKYAAVAVEYAARGIEGKLLFQNDRVNRKGKAIDRSGRVKSSFEYLDICANAVRQTIHEKEDILTFLSISGTHVHQKLVDEYCRYLHEKGIERNELEIMISRIVRGAVTNTVQEAIHRLKMSYSQVEGEKPSSFVAEGDDLNETPVEHADMDDLAQKLQHVRTLFHGVIKISRPTGTEWHEKVEDSWQGEISGRWTTVRLDRRSGKMYSDEGRFWRRFMTAELMGTAEVKVGVAKFGLTGKPMFGMPEIDPLKYLNRESDRKLARMAVYAAEKQRIICSQNSSSYLLHATGTGEERPRIHIASITADILNGMDLYFDRSGRKLFVKFLTRFMLLTMVSEEKKLFRLTQVADIDRQGMYLANTVIRRRGYKLI